MFLFGKDLDKDVCVIAEIGVNHEGSFETARKMLHLAKESGADAAKFQTYTAEKFISSNDPARLERVKRFGLSEEDFIRLKGEGDKIGLPVFSAAISDDVIPFLADHFPVIKIASGDLTFEPVITAALKTGKPVILSTGLGTVEEIEQAIQWALAALGGDSILLKERLFLMHCVSAYPVPVEQANILAVPYLAEKFGLYVGYSNHVEGIGASLAAVAHGACMVEVHFTDCKTGREFRDHALSCDPNDLKMLTTLVPTVKQSLGEKTKKRMPCEQDGVLAMRKGLIAAQDLKVGDVISADMLAFARPATEFSSNDLGLVVGQRVIEDISEGHTIPRSAVEGA